MARAQRRAMLRSILVAHSGVQLSLPFQMTVNGILQEEQITPPPEHFTGGEIFDVVEPLIKWAFIKAA